MKKIICIEHRIEFQLPTTEEEFLSGKLHNDIRQIQLHSEEFPQCKMMVNNS
jgi:hypothetical protein